jgi:RHS repeat-associated protein
VGYTHAGGVDRPLVAYKGSDVVVPQMNWRGLFSRGTNAAGGPSTVPVAWPGFRTTAWHYTGQTQIETKNWMGSLLEGQRDAGGQMYMRNRYYDPGTGQFTQTDPIGIAGGLNTYGFAAGDPVSYSDPYGLAPETDPEKDKCKNITSEQCPIVLEPVVVVSAKPRGLYRTSCPFVTCGVVNKHYDRNVHNIPAPSLDAALDPDGNWELQSDFRSQYHRYGPGNERNMKFVSKDGHHESVFRPDGTLVTDCINGGTYNYGTNDVSHLFFDIAPFKMFGNCR